MYCDDTNEKNNIIYYTMVDNPRLALHILYGKKKRLIANSDFYSWCVRVLENPTIRHLLSQFTAHLVLSFSWTRHDGGAPHAMKWTSVFCCPISGEVFPSGRLQMDGIEPAEVVFDEVTGQEVIFYDRKKMAEHAAAARAHDCIIYREATARAREGEWDPASRFGEDEPYLQDNEMRLPASARSGVLEGIDAVRARLGNHPRNLRDALQEEEEEEGEADDDYDDPTEGAAARGVAGEEVIEEYHGEAPPVAPGGEEADQFLDADDSIP